MGSMKKLFAIIHIFKSYNSSLIYERGVYIHYIQSLILIYDDFLTQIYNKYDDQWP